MKNEYADKHKINVERFNSYVGKGKKNECWNWKGNKDSLGYGRFHVGKSRNSTMLAHRISFGLATGFEPEAVCHKCDNPSCCNPNHLEAGTRDYNNKDMKKKGRHWLHTRPEKAVKGEQHGESKLKEVQVLEIRRLYSTGNYKQRDLAQQFGVCQRTIAKIVNFIGWKHVEDTDK